MSSKKINQLPLFPGTDTSEVYLVVNDKTETTTYKIKKETLLGTSGNSGNSGTSGISGTSGVNGSNSGTSGVSGTAGTSGTAQTLTSLTYSAFTELITNSELIKGCFYEINDYETCYDQPDFNPTINVISSSDDVTTGNYKTSGVIQPIIVFATATNEISIDAFQAAYPKDKIQYDWTIAVTEVTGNPAKGRIIERIDELNNRTDYDHRNILFKRYTTYIPNERLPGLVFLDSNGRVIGTDTTFTSLSIGDRIWIRMNTGNQMLGNLEYMITAIVDDTNMTVTGITIAATYDAIFYTTSTMTGYKRNNTSNPSGFTEHYTFSDDKFCFNNYIGNYGNLKNWTRGYNTAADLYLRSAFYLANNVFLGDCVNNIIGDNAYNNAFLLCNNNIIGAGFKGNNVSSLEGNVIGNNFANNTININTIANNKIGNYFYNNVITCGTYFNKNQIGFAFYKNIITCVDFANNIVGSEFYNNKIRNGEFYDNTIGSNFINNTITTANFNKNQIAIDFKNNINIIGNFKNNIYQIATNGKDYLAATHVYQTYTCVVFTNAASIQRLSYYDATDVLIITTPNS